MASRDTILTDIKMETTERERELHSALHGACYYIEGLAPYLAPVYMRHGNLISVEDVVRRYRKVLDAIQSSEASQSREESTDR